MVTDETSLDWRLLMQENIFKLDNSDAESAPAAAVDSVADGEQIDKIKFRVDNLLILGLMYCKCSR